MNGAMRYCADKEEIEIMVVSIQALLERGFNDFPPDLGMKPMTIFSSQRHQNMKTLRIPHQALKVFRQSFSITITSSHMRAFIWHTFVPGVVRYTLSTYHNYD